MHKPWAFIKILFHHLRHMEGWRLAWAAAVALALMGWKLMGEVERQAGATGLTLLLKPGVEESDIRAFLQTLPPPQESTLKAPAQLWEGAQRLLTQLGHGGAAEGEEAIGWAVELLWRGLSPEEEAQLKEKVEAAPLLEEAYWARPLGHEAFLGLYQVAYAGYALSAVAVLTALSLCCLRAEGGRLRVLLSLGASLGQVRRLWLVQCLLWAALAIAVADALWNVAQATPLEESRALKAQLQEAQALKARMEARMQPLQQSPRPSQGCQVHKRALGRLRTYGMAAVRAGQVPGEWAVAMRRLSGLLKACERQKRLEESLAETQAQEKHLSFQLQQSVLVLTDALTALPDRHGEVAPQGRLFPPVYGSVEREFGPFVNPKSNTVVLHKGLGIRTAGGSRVRAVAKGKVAFVGHMKGLGRLVIVEHPGGWHSLVAQLQEVYVEAQQEVAQGSWLGTLEAEGLLYFEIRLKGEAQNPREWLSREGFH